MKKLNKLDYAIISIIIIGILFFTFTKLKESDNPIIVTNTKSEVTFTVETDKVTQASLDVFKVGDQLVSEGKLLDAYITDVKVENFKENYVLPDGTITLKEDPSGYKLTISAKANVDTSSPLIYVGPLSVKIGKRYNMKTLTGEVYSTVISMNIGE
jgi:hypothetical protein